MARIRPGDSDAVKIEQMRSEVDKLRITETNKTRRHLGLCALATTMTAIFAWAAVRMTEKPPWLVFGLAVVAAVGGQVFFSFESARRLKRASNRRPRRDRDDLIDQPEEEQ